MDCWRCCWASLFVFFLFGTILSQGYSALPAGATDARCHYDPAGHRSGRHARPEALATANYTALVRASLRELFPEVQGRAGTRALYGLVSNSAAIELQRRVEADPALIGKRATRLRSWLADVDQLLKGHIDRSLPEDSRVADRPAARLGRCAAGPGRACSWSSIRGFFTGGDSREPEQAGVWGAVVGSMYTLLVTLLLSFPIGVAAAIYLEEFAPRNRWTDLIEVNINNLAAVPSIVFGLLGLAVFLNFFGMPRSAPLVGGFVLTLLTLPTIIIAVARGAQGRAAVDPRGGAGHGRLASCRWWRTMCCRWPCPASSPAPSSAWRARWARPRRC